ncbi:MAG TPA: tRNA-dihydrouridine synthase, partial [Spirochaetota bacterium]|nr:tRNA-dihydrouridine synthase [Spirochaetota bacterium]
MDRDKIRDLLEKVRGGSVDVTEAMNALRILPFEDLGFARTDSHRALRTGYPEVVYCMGKTIAQICTIVERLSSAHKTIIASRATDEVYEAVKKAVSTPVAVVGGINDPAMAEDIIAEGKADLVALGRQALADPEFPNKAQTGRTDEISPCIRCGCFSPMPQIEGEITPPHTFL